MGSNGSICFKKNPININELQTYCLEYWDNVLTMEIINKLCDGFRLRINEMLYKKGHDINEFIRNHFEDKNNDLDQVPPMPPNLKLWDDMVILKNPELEDNPDFKPEIREAIDPLRHPQSPTKDSLFLKDRNQIIFQLKNNNGLSCYNLFSISLQEI